MGLRVPGSTGYVATPARGRGSGKRWTMKFWGGSLIRWVDRVVGRERYFLKGVRCEVRAGNAVSGNVGA